MKVLKLFSFLIWMSVLGTVIASVPYSANTVSNSKVDYGLRKKNYKRAVSQPRTNFYGYTYFPWTPYNTCIAVIIWNSIKYRIHSNLSIAHSICSSLLCSPFHWIWKDATCTCRITLKRISIYHTMTRSKVLYRCHLLKWVENNKLILKNWLRHHHKWNTSFSDNGWSR